nr:collagenase-like [Vanessa tameamea]
MAAWGALVCLLAVSWVSAYPSPPQFVYPENARDDMTRIVSGWEAKDGDIPYQLSLRMVGPIGTVNACGATLIHNEWALTAAHCTANRVTVIIRAGGVSLLRPAAIFETTDYYNHPEYIESFSQVQPHDIGLIRLNRFLEYSSLIQPIRLQASVDKNKNYNDVKLHASGWGRTWTNGASPVNLNWVYLSGVSNQHCKDSYGGSSIIVDSTICARGYNVTSQSTCQGDSGGPLVTEDVDGTLTQVGISSFVSITGCHTDFPAGFIRPGHYHDWYLEVTGINFDWDPSQAVTTTTAAEPTEPDVTTAAPEEEEEEEVEEEEEEEEASEEDSETSEENGETSEEGDVTSEEQSEEDENEEEGDNEDEGDNEAEEDNEEEQA